MNQSNKKDGAGSVGAGGKLCECTVSESNNHALLINKCPLCKAASIMYEALNRFVDAMKSEQREKCDIALAMAKDALASAEGRLS